MQIRDDWPITFDEEQLQTQVGGSLPRLLAQPRVRFDWEAAFAEAPNLIRPIALWDTFPIRAFRHDRLELANAVKIGGGPVTTVVAGATHLVVGVCSAGSAISQRISDEQRNGHRLRAMFLDHIGSWAVDQVRQQLCRRVEAQANSEGLRASASLSPANRSGR